MDTVKPAVTVTDIYPNCPLHFLVKRAFRLGRVRRADVMDAFSLSASSATRVMQAGRIHYDGLLYSQGQSLYPVPGVAAPEEANEPQLMACLTEHRTSLAETGIRPEELPVYYPSSTSGLPAFPGVLDKLVKALADKVPVSLLYVGKRSGDKATLTRVMPYCFEQWEGQWRLLGIKLSPCVATGPCNCHVPFLLARILDVIPLPRLKRYRVPGNERTYVIKQYRATLNQQLTPDQALVARNELELAGQSKWLPAHLLPEAQAIYAGVPNNEADVAPLTQLA